MKICTEGFAIKGEPTVVTEGTLLEDGHDLVKRFPSFFSDPEDVPDRPRKTPTKRIAAKKKP